jgi:hypothetical protein
MIRYFIAVFASSLLLVACATTDYVGETYTPTTHVDVFFDASEISRSFKTMGTAKTEGTEYLTFEVIEQQLVKDAMSKGADAIIIDGMDTIKVGSTSSTSGKSAGKPRYIVTEDGKLKNVGGDGHYSSISTTTDIRDKVIKARLIKYD